MQVYLHHLEFAETLLERVLLWQGKSEHFEISGKGKELLEGEAGTGCLLFSAHFGSFDVLRVLAKELKSRVNVVMFRSHAVRFNKFLEEINPEANLRVVELNPGEIEGVLKLKTCIEQGEHVAILADRVAPMGRQRVSKVDFLGSEAPFPESPWLLAKVLNCPVLFVCAERTGARSYRVTVDPLAQKISGHSDISKHIQDFAHRLESLCSRRPKQWFNFYNFWGSADQNA